MSVDWALESAGEFLLYDFDVDPVGTGLPLFLFDVDGLFAEGSRAAFGLSGVWNWCWLAVVVIPTLSSGLIALGVYEREGQCSVDC